MESDIVDSGMCYETICISGVQTPVILFVASGC